MLVGYARVSTRDQDLTVQRNRLQGCERLFEETASGTDAARPALKQCLKFLREGDTLVVTRLDRLARSTLHLYTIATQLQQEQVQLLVLDQGVDTRTSTGRLLFGMLAIIAQFETELRAERQAEGIARARQQGIPFGRKRHLTPTQATALREQRGQGVPIKTLMREYRLSKAAIYRYLKQATLGEAEVADEQREGEHDGTNPAHLLRRVCLESDDASGHAARVVAGAVAVYRLPGRAV